MSTRGRKQLPEVQGEGRFRLQMIYDASSKVMDSYLDGEFHCLRGVYEPGSSGSDLVGFSQSVALGCGFSPLGKKLKEPPDEVETRQEAGE